MKLINPIWSLDQIQTESPLWGALIAADGGSVIPLLLNPIAIKRGQSANTSVLSLYQGGSRVIWLGNSPTNYTLDLVVTGGLQQDVTPVLDRLASTVGRTWRYVHGQRVTPTLLMTNVSIDEEKWLNGKPVRAQVSLQMITVGTPGVIIITYSDLTEAEITDIIRQARAQGYQSVTVEGTTVLARGSVIGTAINGIFNPLP